MSLAAKFGQPDIGPRFQRQILIARAMIRGFLVSDYAQHHPQARNRIGEWYRAGLLESKFDVAKGIENMPQAFLRLLESRNLGKQIVQVGDEPADFGPLLGCQAIIGGVRDSAQCERHCREPWCC